MQPVPSVGMMINDRYYVEQILNSSRCTAVLKCIDTRLDVKCAIKLLLVDSTDPNGEQIQQIFINTFKTQAKLNHPSILRVTDIETRWTSPFAVMELLSGLTLQQYIEQASRPQAEVLEYIESIADALAMAHSMNIIHMGICPRNIFLNQQGNRYAPRLMNFAYIRDVNALSSIDEMPYLSPEQFFGYTNVSAASDVYSLCATLYYAFVRNLPVYNDDVQSYIKFFSDGIGVDDFPKEVPMEYISLLQNGLKVSPEKRIPNATEFARLLKSISKGENVVYSSDSNQSLERVSPAISPFAAQGIPTLPSLPPQPAPSQPADNPNNQPPQIGISPRLAAQQVGNPPQPSPQIGMSPRLAAQQTGNPVSPASQSSPQISLSPRLQQQQQAAAANHDSQPPIGISKRLQNNNPDGKSSPGNSRLPSQPGRPGQSGALFGMIPKLPQQVTQVYKPGTIISDQPHATVMKAAPFNMPNTNVILKCLRNKDPERIRVFSQSVATSVQLAEHCPYFQRIINGFPEYGILVSEDIPRQSLPEYIQTNGVPAPNVAIQIILMIAQGMELAHQMNYINGNLKPTNLFFENMNGAVTPVIYDFAQRQYVRSPSELTIAEIPFVAPELNFNLQIANVQSDIFSFGMLALYLLVGHSPYQSTSQNELVMEILSLPDAPSVSQFRNDVPADLVQVIQWCTTFIPAGRYASFSDVVRDLFVIYNQMSQSSQS